MVYAEAWLLAVIAVVGGVCSITDFRNNIVANKVLLIGIVAGIPGHIALLLTGGLPFYATWALNMLIADILSFLLYKGKMWAAGDAKLFMTLYYLIPPVLLDTGFLTFSIVPYIYIFLPALGWMAFDSVVRTIRKEPGKNPPFDLMNLVKTCAIVLLETMALYAVGYCFLRDFITNHEMFFAALMMIYAYCCGSSKKMRGIYVIIFHGAVLILVWVLGRQKIFLPDWRTLLLMAAVVVFQRFASRYNYNRIEPQNVRKGMILASETVIQFQTSRVQGLPTDFSEELTARITEEEAEAVRRWGKSAKGQAYIWIVRKVPFAFMISLGFVAWMIVRIVGV